MGRMQYYVGFTVCFGFYLARQTIHAMSTESSFVCSRSASAERNENRKSQVVGIIGRPSGMCGGGGRGYGEGQRSAKSEICNFVIVYLSSCAVDPTRQLLSTTRAADHYAHTAGPVQGCLSDGAPQNHFKIHQSFDKCWGDAIW